MSFLRLLGFSIQGKHTDSRKRQSYSFEGSKKIHPKKYSSNRVKTVRSNKKSVFTLSAF